MVLQLLLRQVQARAMAVSVSRDAFRGAQAYGRTGAELAALVHGHAAQPATA